MNLSEAHRYIISVSMAIAILSMLTIVTFIFMIYTDFIACQRLCELVESRLIEVIAYAQFEGNVTVILSLNDIASRPFELYVVNSTCIEVRVPLRYLSNIVVKRHIVLPEHVTLNYTGLIPSKFAMVFREVNGRVVINVRT